MKFQKRLYLLSTCFLAEANKGNPFISKSEAMADLNRSRLALKK